MAKISIPSVSEISKNLKKEKILPVYFLFGEDGYALENSLGELRNAVVPLILSDFDIEIISGEKTQSLSQVLDLALTFPFGGGKKFIIIKNFEKINDKKELTKYLVSPPDFTVLAIVNYGNITDLSKEPYSSLVAKKYIFQARSERGEELISWIVERANELEINLSSELARVLIEIVGEEKSILNMQLQKLLDYVKNQKEVTFDELRKISSPIKQFSIFDFQDALGKGDKSKSIEIAYNIIDSNQEIVVVINMIAKYIITIAQITELIKSKVNDNEGAKMLGVSWYYYVNCKKAKYLISDEKLEKASKALFKADLAVKTTNTDPKTILLVLISEMLN